METIKIQDPKKSPTNLTLFEPSNRPALATLKEDHPKIRHSDVSLISEVINYIVKLMNITKPDTPEDKKQMDIQMLLVGDLIRTEFGSLTGPEIKQAFKMYVSKKLPSVKVYRLLDCICVGEVLSAYTEIRNGQLASYESQKTKLLFESQQFKMSPEEIRELLKKGVLRCFDEYFTDKKIADGNHHLFDFLYEIEILPKWNHSQKTFASYEKIKAKAVFEIRRELQIKKRYMKNKADVQDIVDQLIRVKAGEDGSIMMRSKVLTLKGFFEKLVYGDNDGKHKQEKPREYLESIVSENMHKYQPEKTTS